jgi:hypothetical protein
MAQVIEARRPWRLGLLAAALAVALLALVAQQARPGAGLASLPLHDFVEYWAAGRLLAQGHDPYDLEAIERLQRSVGHTAEPILMWNPPWALPLVLPLGLLECRTAHLVWLLLNLAVLAGCADLLWRLYDGPAELRWLGWLLGLAFLPSAFALLAGQIAPLLLLGVTGFLWCQRRGHDLRAGAAAALLGIKPHLAYLFWPALLLWCLHTRRWRVLLGGAGAGLAALGVALWFDPDVLAQYAQALSTRPPAQYRSPTLGTLLRLAVGAGSFRLQFLALLPGLAWFVPYWLRHRRDWSWLQRLPLMLLVSLLTAAYGAWPFDLVLLLPAVLQPAAALARSGRPLSRALACAACAAINGLALVLVVREAEYLWFIWMTPALLLAYLALPPTCSLGGATAGLSSSPPQR